LKQIRGKKKTVGEIKEGESVPEKEWVGGMALGFYSGFWRGGLLVRKCGGGVTLMKQSLGGQGGLASGRRLFLTQAS